MVQKNDVVNKNQEQPQKPEETNPIFETEIGIDGYQQDYEIYSGLRKRFPNSYFLPDIYDEGIRGVDCITESVIYDFIASGFFMIRHHEFNRAGLNDCMYGGDYIMDMIRKLIPEELQGKVKPTIMLIGGDMKYWDDMKNESFL